MKKTNFLPLSLAGVAILLLTLMIGSQASAYEPQTLSPDLDQEFIASLGLRVDPAQDRINILIVAQDNRGPRSIAKRKTEDGRPVLASRSDIVMILSIDKSNHKMRMISIYRGYQPFGVCPQATDSALINAIYVEQGRKIFIDCVENIVKAYVEKDPDNLSGLLDADGDFQVNALYEATRNNTIRPLAKDVIGVVKGNLGKFISIYGMSAVSSAFSVFMSEENAKAAIDTEAELNLEDSQIDDHYLKVEMKEREIYKAGGYQRAFNSASTVATVLGWAAYGLESFKDEQYQFLGPYFAKAIDDNLSHSINYVELEKAFSMDNGSDHIFRYAGYKNGSSPMDIVQLGEAPGIYSIYSQGAFSFPKYKGAYMKLLKYVNIVPTPPEVIVVGDAGPSVEAPTAEVTSTSDTINDIVRGIVEGGSN